MLRSCAANKTLTSRSAAGRRFATLRLRYVVRAALGSLLVVLLLVGAEPASASVWSQSVATPRGAKGTDLKDVSCTSRTNCVAVGSYWNRDAQWPGFPLIERWNGETWAIQRIPRPLIRGRLNAVSCISVGACTAVGYEERPHHALVERWNGKTWSIQPTNTVGELNAVSCASSRSCVAVDNLDLALHWNGRTWSVHSLNSDPAVVGGGFTSYGVSCTSNTFCIAVGVTDNAGGESAVTVNRWNGTRWSLQRSPVFHSGGGATLFGVSCISRSFCIAVGTKGGYGSLRERWNGRRWSLQPAAPENPSYYRLHDVSCTSSNACIAVGDRYLYEGPLLPAAERWNGTGWSIESVSRPSGAESMVLNGVSCLSSTACIVTGSFTDRAGRDWPLVESTISPTGGLG